MQLICLNVPEKKLLTNLLTKKKMIYFFCFISVQKKMIWVKPLAIFYVRFTYLCWTCNVVALASIEWSFSLPSCALLNVRTSQCFSMYCFVRSSYLFNARSVPSSVSSLVFSFVGVVVSLRFMLNRTIFLRLYATLTYWMIECVFFYLLCHMQIYAMSHNYAHMHFIYVLSCVIRIIMLIFDVFYDFVWYFWFWLYFY